MPLGDDRERAERAAHQPRQIVAGDVLHDLAAGLRDACRRRARARYPDHEIARRAVAMAQRAAVVGRDDAADASRRAVRRIERQPLPVAGLGAQRRVERRAGACRPGSSRRGRRARCATSRSSSRGRQRRRPSAGRPQPSFVPPPRGTSVRPSASGGAQQHPPPPRRRSVGAQPSEALGQPGRFDRMLRDTDPGTSPHSRGVGKILPGLQMPGRVERAAHALHQRRGRRR